LLFLRRVCQIFQFLIADALSEIVFFLWFAQAGRHFQGVVEQCGIGASQGVEAVEQAVGSLSLEPV